MAKGKPSRKSPGGARQPSSPHSPEFIDGPLLLAMFQSACDGLERNQEAIDSLNVFPVPDGDTGTNMLLTMKSALKECDSAPRTATGIANAVAKGALMGARGNSGVILSQIMRGFASAIDGHDRIDEKLLSQSLASASQSAYKAVSKPVEGTMLTVIREASEGAKSHTGVANVMKGAARAAENAVLKTPDLLPTLKEAGVVDSGGQGVSVILKAMHQRLTGDAAPSAAIPASRTAISSARATDDGYGYCTEFLIEGRDLDMDNIRSKVMELGGSTLVAGDSTLVKVHLHTSDPGKALTYGTLLGSLKGIKIDNIDSQHEEYVKSHKAKPLAVIAVALGDGLVDVFRGLGVDEIVKGGQTMNPSAEEIAQAIDRAPSANVIILPNNPNVIMTANAAAQLSQKIVKVVPTLSIPQGVAAALAMDPEGEVAANVVAMTDAAKKIGTIEFCRATKATSVKGRKIEKGQPIALSEGEISSAGSSFEALIIEALRKVGLKEGMMVTLYFGKDVSKESAEAITGKVKTVFPSVELELVSGGQPHYEYIVSYE